MRGSPPASLRAAVLPPEELERVRRRLGARMTGTVLEEGLRGAGGYLLDGNGERFMDRYDARGERAHDLLLDLRLVLEQRAEAAIRDHEGPNGRRGHHARRARPAGER